MSDKYCITESKCFIPVELSVHGMNVLVVGGGIVGLKRAHRLLAAGANVHLVAPELKGKIDAKIHWMPRAFNAADLQDIHLLIIATPDKMLNDDISSLASAKNILINRADESEKGSLKFMKTLSQSHLNFAISTKGFAPFLLEYLSILFEKTVFFANFFVEHLYEHRSYLKIKLKDLSSTQRSLYYNRLFSKLKKLHGLENETCDHTPSKPSLNIDQYHLNEKQVFDICNEIFAEIKEFE